MDNYKEYKNFRNRLGRFDLVESLETIGWFFRNLSSLSNFLGVPRKKLLKFVQPWNLLILAKEMILWCDYYPDPPTRSLRNRKDFAYAYDKLHELYKKLLPAEDQEIVEEYVYKLPFLQFDFQEKAHIDYLWKYIKLYDHTYIDNLFVENFGISFKKFVLIGLSFLQNSFINVYPTFLFEKVRHSKPPIDSEDVSTFLSIFSISLADLHMKLINNFQSDFSKLSWREVLLDIYDLRAYPLIEITKGKYLNL